MIRSKDLNYEIKMLELVIDKGKEEEVNRGLLKAFTLVLKVLRDIKTNQVSRMKHDNIKMIEPRTPSKDGDKTEGKEYKKKV